jgi:hypothetical protein
MRILAIFILASIVLNLALLAKLTRKTVLIIDVAVAVLVMTILSLKDYFELGPHIELPGWVAGLVFLGVFLLSSAISMGISAIFRSKEKRN